ncbi:MAG: hypothetical protein E7J25_07825 [Paeniclostridium sordellii]|nr:hypothetical protein [Paeniclostridium sordellii]
MDNKNMKLIYLLVGSLMLVLLQTPIFQNSLGFINITNIPYFFGDIIFYLSGSLSFIVAIIFTIVAFEIMINNINFKRE